MDDDGQSTASVDRDVKHEHQTSKDMAMTDAKPTYKSWKKKYRKMRISFDQKMQECEQLHREEQRALAVAKRIAIENDRMLDLLLDMNESDQIPVDKRINITLTTPDSDDTIPDAENASLSAFAKPTKSLGELLKEVPHTSYDQAKDRFPAAVADLEPFPGESHPPTFLTSDDMDDYLYSIDRRIDDTKLLPTLAPSARPNAGSSHINPYTSQNIALRNPVSVYNWLRKHAPKTFLQDTETPAADETHGDETPADTKRKRRPAIGTDSASKSARGGKAARGGKRRTAADRLSVQQKESDAWDVSMDDDLDISSLSTPVPASARGGGKRKRDEDPGYRPKGGSGTRPAKKKRKSAGDGGEVPTPTANKGGSSARRSAKSRASDVPKAKAEKADD
ncbi:hypothetical protein SODALDRAFT_270353 [Sodiomyces alkalinus F11]|uniref:IEC3 subunit of the Ino80 complex, chromatin re-modelling-domain-containing protein n=1 Tax=Sodiomyces alkalinus (strain CBS 110278 / VKM F-3762 / F11) TaxID=1314773 RepID=A0A3N2Q3T2_SODAK|nr:hypothetical protein SODALDRAFT_270353 [Sodiomyces alkalinus F11]ROT41419.1 hypothetical protein SODALDRAFT_270353 [Sodiomyces alkalinus F11]